jgi:cytochrome c oxidase subunit 2
MEQFLGLPPDGSAHGQQIDHLIVLLHWLMFVLFVGWGIFYVSTLVRFRATKNPKANYYGVKNHLSTYLEVAVLIAEVILLVGFSIPIWSERVDAFPNEKDAIVVRVVAEQFAWNIHYPGKDGIFGKTSVNLVEADNPLGLDRNDPNAKDDITTINQLNLPVNKPAILHISSKDVIHSFNVPPYRIKQDAVPGLNIPLWFLPTKTTEQIREEMREQYSITDVMKKVKKISLPSTKTITIAKGENLNQYLLMETKTSSDGSILASEGDRLTEEIITALVEGGVTQVTVRPLAHLDKFIAMEEYKNADGEVVVNKHDPLSDDAVNKLLGIGVKEVSARPVSNLDVFVAMETYNDKTGSPIISKGEALSEDILTKLSENGINQIIMAPATPTEIACAQLCGLGHYRMRGYVTVQSQEDFNKWYDEQEASVLGTEMTTETTSETVSIAAETQGLQH